MTTNQRVLLASRPEGWPTVDSFSFDEVPTPEPGEGQILVRNVYLSVDPYMRGRMNDVKSYIAPFEVGEPLEGGVVGQVVASRSDRFEAGDWVSGMLRWESFSVSDLGESASLAWVALSPKDDDASFSLVKLGFAGSDLAVMELMDNFGQTTRLRFSEVRKNQTIDPQVFSLDVPEGVDVIESGNER